MENYEEFKALLFRKAETALTAYQAAVAAHYPSPEADRRQAMVCALWDVIETARLDREFEEWKAG